MPRTKPPAKKARATTGRKARAVGLHPVIAGALGALSVADADKLTDAIAQADAVHCLQAGQGAPHHLGTIRAALRTARHVLMGGYACEGVAQTLLDAWQATKSTTSTPQGLGLPQGAAALLWDGIDTAQAVREQAGEDAWNTATGEAIRHAIHQRSRAATQKQGGTNEQRSTHTKTA